MIGEPLESILAVIGAATCIYWAFRSFAAVIDSLAHRGRIAKVRRALDGFPKAGDIDSPEIRIANDEPCYHNLRQRDCRYYQESGCQCNRPGSEASVDGVRVRYAGDDGR